LVTDSNPRHFSEATSAMTDAMLPLPALSPFSGKTVVAKFDGCESFWQVPKRIMLDIGDTFDAVHGGPAVAAVQCRQSRPGRRI
jgi:hypothetical protein